MHLSWVWFSNPQKVLDGTGKLELERVPGHVAWVLVLNCFAVVLIIRQSYNIFYWSCFPVLWGLSRLPRREYFCLLLMYNLNEISLPIAGINQTKNNSQWSKLHSFSPRIRHSQSQWKPDLIRAFAGTVYYPFPFHLTHHSISLWTRSNFPTPENRKWLHICFPTESPIPPQALLITFFVCPKIHIFKTLWPLIKCKQSPVGAMINLELPLWVTKTSAGKWRVSCSENKRNGCNAYVI